MKSHRWLTYLFSALLFTFLMPTFAADTGASVSDVPAVRDIEGNPGKVWDDISWANMNSTEQQLWGILGWDAHNWENETAAQPASENKKWQELTEEERQAAGKLHYTEQTWNE